MVWIAFIWQVSLKHLRFYRDGLRGMPGPFMKSGRCVYNKIDEAYIAQGET